MIFKIREGKNREIRNICELFLWNIVKLIRIQYGSIKLTKQKPGEIIEVKNFSSTL
jgi:23S rRNA pseudouridine2605 synthase